MTHVVRGLVAELPRCLWTPSSATPSGRQGGERHPQVAA